PPPAQPPAPAPAPRPSTAPKPPTRPNPPAARRPLYRSVIKAVGKKKAGSVSLVELTLLLTVPAVLAAALLRPRSATRRNR
ncbi:hypothetical protein, partial [Streptosporangium nondiastaticum]|uniref:hypothetical protein n=1 Tax=Streptosporangium nondiastaticum TaxID=35764 RepID=UPI001CB88B4D